jgi:hypothetical protein
MSRGGDSHCLYFRNPKQLVSIGVPRNRIFGTYLSCSFPIGVTNSDKIAFGALTENPYLVLAPESCAYDACADTFQIPELPLPIEV